MSAEPRHFRWAYARRMTAMMFLLLLLLGRFEWFPWFKGVTTATSVALVIPLIDPLAGAEVMLAGRHVGVDLAIGMAILLTCAVLLGPVFCGWVCPLGFVLDINQSLRRFVLRRAGMRHKATSSENAHWRYAILGLTIGLALTLRLPVFQMVSPINLVAWALVHGAITGLVVIGAIAVLEWFHPRVWCRVACPLGAVYSLVGRWGLLRVRINPAEAGKKPCRQCTLHCPMGIRVMEDYSLAQRSSVDHPECTRCGDCVDACPRPVLRLGFKNSHPWPSGQVDSCHGCELMDGEVDHSGNAPRTTDAESAPVTLNVSVTPKRTPGMPLDKNEAPGL